ncbi:MAG: 16S rRNA (guanine(527)-N(7))-methyltransferase RsmG [Bdellovibrionia bacterium]
MAHKNDKNYSPYKARQEARQKAKGSSPAKGAAVTSAPLQGKHKKPEVIFSVEEANDRLADVFRNHEFDLVTHEQRRQLAQFYRLLMLNQEHQNFTRLLKLRDIAIKHYIDCLIITQHCKLQFPLMDVGTGPGFPGIPLKILFPKEKIILAEGVQKRVEFLKQVRQELDLQNLEILGRNINKYCVYPVQGVITRAVEDISNTLGNVLSCLQVSGKVYFMKGPGVAPEIDMAQKEWSEFYKKVSDIAYTLPHTPHERRLVVFEKIKAAPLPEDDPEENLLLEELSKSERSRWSIYK